MWVIGATMLWGAVAGVVAGFCCAACRSAPASAGPSMQTLLVAGVGLPLIEGALMLVGPLLLLRQRRFNDVLDGATFGAAAAVSFTGAHLIVQSLPVLSAGLRAGRRPAARGVVQLISLGVLQPVIAAGAIGAVGGRVLAALPLAGDRPQRAGRRRRPTRRAHRWRRRCSWLPAWPRPC